PFKRPKDFDLKRFDDEGRFGFGDGKKIRLTFRITKAEGAHLLESPLSADQQVKEFDEDYEISATVVDSAMLEWWLRAFGDAVSQVRRRKAAPSAHVSDSS
ncbi:MAG: WYL domain-containing protein, partial [Proteobacteria bacterium]